MNNEKYCSNCGRQLVIKKLGKIQYSKKSGKPLYRIDEYKCPAFTLHKTYSGYIDVVEL